MKIFIFLGLFFYLLLVRHLVAEEEFSFDASAFQKKVFEFDGYVEGKFEHLSLDQSAALYQLNFHNQPDRSSLDRQTGTAEFTGRFKKPTYLLEFTAHAERQHDQLAAFDDSGLYEAFFSFRPEPGMTLEGGKRAIKWGKGYAWNPVGFVERPKDPNDPELSREGFIILSADFIRSFDGPLKTLAFTPVYLPVTEDINTDFGQPEHNNFAAKLYLLYREIDIDLLYLSKGSRPQQYGIDFSYNAATNFELHGEWSTINDLEKPVIDATGNISITQENVHNYLLGLRYLAEHDTTFIVEYYRNGAGYSEHELDDFYQLIFLAEQTSDDILFQLVDDVGQRGYVKRNPGEQYLYVRISNKEPFDLLYFTPTITTIINLVDESYSLTPEVLYTGVTNLELRFRAVILSGERLTEFGEKQNDSRLELRLRYYF